jgi:hypothetical protein
MANDKVIEVVALRRRVRYGYVVSCGQCRTRLWWVRNDQADVFDPWDDWAKRFADGAWRLDVEEAVSWRFDDDGTWRASREAGVQRARAEARLRSGRMAPDDPRDPRRLSPRARTELRERLKRNRFSDYHESETVGALALVDRLATGLGGAFDLPARIECPGCRRIRVVNLVEPPPED